MELDYWNFSNGKDLDYRADFANDVAKLMYEKHNGDLDKCVKDWGKFYDYFEEYVRNIYEIADDQIPLTAYYYLLISGADNFGLSEEEFEEAKRRCVEACHKYYK